MPVPKPDVPGQATLFAVAKKKNIHEAPLPTDLDIVFWTGPGYEQWTPHAPYREGIGGSEIACIEMAKLFAARGHNVTVYSDCPHREGLYDGVKYRHFGRLMAEGAKCDVFICSRQATSINQYKIDAKIKILWVHDIHCGDASAEMHASLLQFDRILTLTEWHRQFFWSMYPFLDRSRVEVTRNGINLERFPTPQRYRGNKLIYTSSGNRGLVTLLDWFPLIKEKVPDVELDVFYGFNTWRASARGNPQELAVIDRIEAKVKETPGVTFRGRVNQQTLAKAWLEAKVWAYPTMFTETSCISAMEAQAAGVVPVTTRLAALAETVKSGVLLDPPTDAAYRDRFVSSVVSLLTDETRRMKYVTEGLAHAQSLSWAALSDDWEQMFTDMLHSKSRITHRYVPVQP